MIFLAILISLIVEQAQPLSRRSMIHYATQKWLLWVLKNFDIGKKFYPHIIWWLAIAVPSILVAIIYYLLMHYVGWSAGLLWSVVLIYLTLGFRQFSSNFTQARNAIYEGNEDKARQLLANWRGISLADLPKNNTLDLLLAYSIINAQRYVFGVMVWYCIGSLLGLGPTGAVFYRLASHLNQHLAKKSVDDDKKPSDILQKKSKQFWFLIDWLPSRITVLGFAFVGSFEDCIAFFRRQRNQTPKDNEKILLAAACGAINMKLTDVTASAEATPVQNEHLQSVVGLVWRMVIVWMVILALLSVARALG